MQNKKALFNTAAIWFSCAVFIGVCLWLFLLLRVTEKDISHYTTLKEKKHLSSSAPHFSATDQLRKKVRKDIWFSQDDQKRLHYWIESEASVLTFIPIYNHFQVVEKLSDVKCLMQEKLFFASENPMQQMRYLEADNGYYCYNSQEFQANHVDISIFRFLGHELPSGLLNLTDALMRGTAQHVSFKISGKTPRFQAHEFKALLVEK